jgi:LysR family transcriptional regulator, carnitine catabolism transcriptional activator
MEFTSRQLRAFHLVAQYRSFTRAAQALFITPSGLSLTIRELENQLGFRLFDRTTRHVVLTDHGQELLSATKSNLEEIDQAMSRIGLSAKQRSLSLSIGAQPLVASNILPPVIKEFRAQQPATTIHVYAYMTRIQSISYKKLRRANSTSAWAYFDTQRVFGGRPFFVSPSW